MNTAAAPRHRLATMNEATPSCQLSPVTKNSIAAAAAPTQANPASRSFFRAVRSATAPSRGRSTAESRVEAVIVYDGRAPGAMDRPSTWIRLSTAASLAIAIR